MLAGRHAEIGTHFSGFSNNESLQFVVANTGKIDSLSMHLMDFTAANATK